MKIARVYSHLNGLEFLKVHKLSMWTEVENVVAAVNANACRTKKTKEKKKQALFSDGLIYSPVAINKEFKAKFSALEWKESRYSYFVSKDEKLTRRVQGMPKSQQKREIEAAGLESIATYNQTDFVKDRVAVEVQFGKYSFVAYDLFVKHMAFFVGDKIDVGIEILPMKALQSLMSSGIAYFEVELSNLVRQGRGVPAVPLVLVGVDV